MNLGGKGIIGQRALKRRLEVQNDLRAYLFDPTTSKISLVSRTNTFQVSGFY